MKKIILTLLTLLNLQAFAKVKDFDKLSAIKDPDKYAKCKQAWDDSCQDEVMKYFYGDNWQEFKQTIFQYQSAMKNKDIDKIVKLVTFPCVQDALGEDGEQYYIDNIKPYTYLESNSTDEEKRYRHHKDLSGLHNPQKQLTEEERHPPLFAYKDIQFLLMTKLGDYANPVIIPFKNYEHAFRFAYVHKADKCMHKAFFVPKIIDHYVFNVIVDSSAENIPFFDRLNAIEDEDIKEDCIKNWTDNCQDQVLKHFYGDSWQGFKDAILEYQKVFPFHSFDDFDKFFKLFVLPSNKSALHIIKGDVSTIHKDETSDNYDAFKDMYYYNTEVNIMEAAKAPYKDMNFHIFQSGNKKFHHMIRFNDNFAISFNLKDYGALVFEPKIYAIFYDFFQIPRNVNKLSFIKDVSLKAKCRGNWDDYCQDEVMKCLFGDNWKEFKEVLIAYQKAISNKDVKATFDLCKLPLTLDYGASIVNKAYFFRGDSYDVSSLSAFADYYKDNILVYDSENEVFLSDLASQALYKNFNFYYIEEFNDKYNLYFDKILIRLTNRYGVGFEYQPHITSNTKGNYKPKIDKIAIFK